MSMELERSSRYALAKSAFASHLDMCETYLQHVQDWRDDHAFALQFDLHEPQTAGLHAQRC